MKKIAVITGGNAGIGLATAHELAARGISLALACRNTDKAQLARSQILQSHPQANIEIHSLDLASFDSIRRFADELMTRHEAVDVLINNAGAAPLKQQFTREGFEMQFGANYLGHFLLTHLLMPVLQKACVHSNDVRVIHLASLAHIIGRIDQSTFRGRSWYRPDAAYAQSKLANLLFSNALARRLPAGISSQALHPGAVGSEIWRDFPRPISALLRLILITPKRAAHLIADMACAPQYADRSGRYESVQWPRPLSRTARSIKEQDELYRVSCELTGVEPLPTRSSIHTA